MVKAKVIVMAQKYANTMNKTVYVYKKTLGYDFTEDFQTASNYTDIETVVATS